MSNFKDFFLLFGFIVQLIIFVLIAATFCALALLGFYTAIINATQAVT